MLICILIWLKLYQGEEQNWFSARGTKNTSSSNRQWSYFLRRELRQGWWESQRAGLIVYGCILAGSRPFNDFGIQPELTWHRICKGCLQTYILRGERVHCACGVLVCVFFVCVFLCLRIVSKSASVSTSASASASVSASTSASVSVFVSLSVSVSVSV